MMTAPVHIEMHRACDERLLASQKDLAVGSSDWQLVEAQRLAGGLVTVSRHIPDILRTEPYMAALLDDGRDADDVDAAHELLVARQGSIDMRLADPLDSLRVTAIMPDDVLDDVRRHAGLEHVGPQAARLLLAQRQGVRVRMVPGQVLRAMLDGITSLTFATELPGKVSTVVYVQQNDPLLPVYSDTTPEAAAAANELKDKLLQQEVGRATVKAIIGAQATEQVLPPKDELFDLQKKR